MATLWSVRSSEFLLRGALLALCCFAGSMAYAEQAAVEVEAAATTDDASTAVAAKQAARTLIAGALDLTRGRTSVAEFTMTIKRPDWQRSSSLKAWTRGREDALIRFTAPAKDAGNATLKQGEKMWTYTPRVNRTIRLPQSLMSQSWAGSDFSYNDLSRSDKLLRYYELLLVNRETQGERIIYTIDAVPADDAPVVWGKEQLVLRDDYVLLSQTFFDQALEPVKRMETLLVGELGGRTFGTHMRMINLEEPDTYTELIYNSAEFDLDLEDRLFTQFSLKSNR
ncbi:MAG: outer membrane lipoprotein-sorting protein [Pseudomonadales bacterium]